MHQTIKLPVSRKRQGLGAKEQTCSCNAVNCIISKGVERRSSSFRAACLTWSRLERIKSDSASLIGSDVVKSGFGVVALTRAQSVDI